MVRSLSAALLAVVLTALPTFAFNEPDGYKEYKWGMPSRDVRQKTLIFDDKIGEIKVSAWLRFLPVGPVMPDSKLAGATLEFASNVYPILKITFVERYGPPTVARTESLKTKGGMEVVNEILRWEGDQSIVELKRYGASILRGGAIISTREWENERGRDVMDKAKRAAGDL